MYKYIFFVDLDQCTSSEQRRTEQQPYERIMVYFSAVTAQWIRV